MGGCTYVIYHSKEKLSGRITVAVLVPVGVGVGVGVGWGHGQFVLHAQFS